MKNKCIFLSFIILFFTYLVQAQRTYLTKKGTIELSGVYEDSVHKIYSRGLLVLLNYDNGDFKMSLGTNTLHSDNTLKHNYFLDKLGGNLDFDGNLDIGYIQTTSHPPQSFGVQGTLYYKDKNVQFVGNGTLKHVTEAGELISCFLGLEIDFKLKDGTLEGENSNNKLHVKVIQAVLKRY